MDIHGWMAGSRQGRGRDGALAARGPHRRGLGANELRVREDGGVDEMAGRHIWLRGGRRSSRKARAREYEFTTVQKRED